MTLSLSKLSDEDGPSSMPAPCFFLCISYFYTVLLHEQACSKNCATRCSSSFNEPEGMYFIFLSLARPFVFLNGTIISRWVIVAIVVLLHQRKHVDSYIMTYFLPFSADIS